MTKHQLEYQLGTNATFSLINFWFYRCEVNLSPQRHLELIYFVNRRAGWEKPAGAADAWTGSGAAVYLTTFLGWNLTNQDKG